MIWLIGLPALTLLGFCIAAVVYRELQLLFIGVLTSLVAAAAAVIINLVLWNVVGYDWVAADENNIKSINDSTATNGSFFLGSGSVDEKPVFWYYKDHGGYSTLEQVSAGAARIVETDDVEPKVVNEVAKSRNTWLAVDEHHRLTFYIPENSITNNFELDAKP